MSLRRNILRLYKLSTIYSGKLLLSLIEQFSKFGIIYLYLELERFDFRFARRPLVVEDPRERSNSRIFSVFL